MTDLIKFDPMEEMPNIIKVIGVGGGGSNAVTHMFTEGIQGVDFILCNTDHQALVKSPVAMKVHLGKRLLGAGNMPEVGRQAAMETTDELTELLSKDTKMVFVTAGMGGGTGTGAAPVVASIAKELGILTVGIVTLPFSFEGKRRQQQAMDGINELRKHVDSLLVISNDKLRQEHGDMKLAQAFKKADDVLKTAAKGIAEIITVTGYVNVDFQDVNTVMRNSGKAIMGSGYAEGDGRARKAVEDAVHSPLLDDSDIRGAKNILIYITSGTDEVSLDEVTEITEYVQEATGNCSEVIWGNGEDMTLGNGLNVTLIATGFDHDAYEYRGEDTQMKKVHQAFEDAVGTKNDKENTRHVAPQPQPEPQPEQISVINRKTEEEKPAEDKENKKIHTLYNVEVSNTETEDDYRPQHNDGITTHRVETERKIDTATQTSRVYHNPFNNNDDDEDLGGVKTYVRDAADTQTIVKHEVKKDQQNQLSQKEILRRQRLTSLNNFTMSDIERLESQPAYMRRGVSVNDDNEQELSTYSFNKGKGISENNSFLHDNVD
ncbi:MAG: cell division protein FtsZ [Lentimicrobiaceae bacterium]|nr:cell division protein FtsZ [Lentimicrobiaceae bacterium]